jgi:hypothetical protein
MGPKSKVTKARSSSSSKSKASSSKKGSKVSDKPVALSKAALKREREKKKRDGGKYLEDMYALYTKPELKPMADTDDEDENSGDDSTDGDNQNNNKKKHVDEILLCTKEGCKRKRGGRSGPCVKDLCFLCCHQSRSNAESGGNVYCPSHYSMSAQKDTEDRYIAEGLNLVKPKKTKFYHYEDKFTNYNQTVTVWCSQDFYANKDFSGDTMADVQRARRNREMLLKRSSSSTCSSTAEKLRAPDAWRALRAAHQKESSAKFNAMVDKYRQKCGKQADCTAHVLR